MRQFAEALSRFPGRHHLPTLGDAGLDVPALASQFDGYYRRFGVGRQQAIPN